MFYATKKLLKGLLNFDPKESKCSDKKQVNFNSSAQDECCSLHTEPRRKEKAHSNCCEKNDQCSSKTDEK